MLEDAGANLGAYVMGRNMFGGGPGPWTDEPWNGWWGGNPPFHLPVFVVTHHARQPLVCDGGTTFTFVTDGAEAAVAQAREAAAGRDVMIAGGSTVARQCLAAGLVDELRLDLVPVLLGDGVRLDETHLILILEFPSAEDADRVAREVGGPWMRAHITPLLAGDTDRSLAEVIASAGA